MLTFVLEIYYALQHFLKEYNIFCRFEVGFVLFEQFNSWGFVFRPHTGLSFYEIKISVTIIIMKCCLKYIHITKFDFYESYNKPLHSEHKKIYYNIREFKALENCIHLPIGE